MKKSFVHIVVLLALLLPSAAFAQSTTVVWGRVTDARTGEGVPYAGVFFKGTTVGQSTDTNGNYRITAEDLESTTLVCQLLGYDSVEKQVQPGSEVEINFSLRQRDTELNAALVKTDNKKVKRLLALMEEHRLSNDPDHRPSYKCEAYSKIELDLTLAGAYEFNPRNPEGDLAVLKGYFDTTSVAGRTSLPVMLSEAVTERRHTSDPTVDEETILANRISGINPDNNMLSQFTGTMRMRVNFYNPFITLIGKQFPSPVQKEGLLYYNYFIVDSLSVDGRKTYKVNFHPKNGLASPAFDGEMKIDAKDYAIRSIKARLQHDENVNWIRDLQLESEYRLVGDSIWFYKNDNLRVDFSLEKSDSLITGSYLGTRNISWREPSFEPQQLSSGTGLVTVLPEANHKSEAWWDLERPEPLESRESGIYDMVRRFQEKKLYKVLYKIGYWSANEYIDVGNIGFGPFLSFVSFNPLEGFRPQIGIHTTPNWSKKQRFSGYVGYGFADKQVKGGATYELMLGKEPFRKLTLGAMYDVVQLGAGSQSLVSGNIISSVSSETLKLTHKSQAYVFYNHELSSRVNASAGLMFNRLYGSDFVPMIGQDGAPLPSIATNDLYLGFRFSKEETAGRGHFKKEYLHTYHPVVSLDLTGSIPGLRPNDYGYFRPEITFDWKARLPPIGNSKIHFNAGTIVGQVPWPLLHLYSSNATFMNDDEAFTCMDYFEFASDTWATLMWRHNFGGLLLEKIPLIRRLNLRETVSLKAAYGTLSDKNDGNGPGSAAPILFPQNMQTLDGVPYVEVGAGLTNIFRLLRVDFSWRLTHLEYTNSLGETVHASRPFAVTVGFELSL